MWVPASQVPGLLAARTNISAEGPGLLSKLHCMADPTASGPAWRRSYSWD